MPQQGAGPCTAHPTNHPPVDVVVGEMQRVETRVRWTVARRMGMEGKEKRPWRVDVEKKVAR